MAKARRRNLEIFGARIVFFRAPTTRVQADYGLGRFGVGPYGSGEPTYDVEVNGQMTNVLDLGRDVLDELEKLLALHGLL